MPPREIGRYILASSGLDCWSWGWSSGTRSKASGTAAVGLDQTRTRFLYRSRLLTVHCALGRQPPQGSSIWLYGGPNVPVSKSRLPVCLELLSNRLPESPGRDRRELELRQSALSMLG